MRADKRVTPAARLGTAVDEAKLVVAFAGSESNAHALVPAVARMRDALTASRVLLLWPSSVRLPGQIEALLEHRLSYPTAPDAVSVRDTVSAVASEGSDYAVVFTETGWSPHVPAYIAYLAGIPRRFGFAAEFAGAVLSDPFAPPGPMPEEERHLLLLDLAGFEDRRSSAAAAAIARSDAAAQHAGSVSLIAGAAP